jgi:outer membrane receptor protein involved in Fe transport
MRRTSVLLSIALLFGGIAVTAYAQSTTATIRGIVKNQSGTALGGAEVSAVGIATGFVRSVTTAADGSFVLGGITPGEINLIVAAPGFDPLSQQVRILLGQNLEMELILSTTAVVAEEITVVGNQYVETETHQAATNVTPAQMESLPQNERNFLNFAALAPGIRVSNDPQRKTIAGDAQPAEQTNIFIDGVSFKNDILQGGVAGQDSSRGNPFPQNAVQEFRVITQNYSAQYDKASSAIITAVTKSGGNEFTGQVFGFYQPKDWVGETEKGFLYSTLTTNADYYRYQYGASIGGPIMKDKLHFFGSYESVDEHATATVNIPNTPFSAQFASQVGEFAKPFRSHLFFGKVSWQPAANQLVDFSTNYRTETEVRDFGGATSYESAIDQDNHVYGTTLRHQWNNNSALNFATLSWQRYVWNPTPRNSDLVGRNYEGLIRVGGASTEQDFDQRRLEFRDDYNFAPIQWRGTHALQVGGNLDFMKYRVNKSLNGNPQYNYRVDPANNLTFDQPFEAVFGFGNPLLESNNNEYGIYGQDTWTFNDRLTLNLGLRWDYESNMIDNDYVTPANIVAGLTGKVDPNYFSSGDDREPYKKAFQPRFGFTYDLSGDGRSVVFGGLGRYYDRLFLNAGLDERYRLQFPVYRVRFSPTGTAGTVRWDPRYLTLTGLQELVAQGSTNPEIFLLNNNTRPPYSNQFNIGYRRAAGPWVTSISYNGVRGYRGFTWLSATGICCSALVPGFGNVLISDNDKRYWFDGIYVTVDRPYTGSTGWGGRVAYTFGSARQNGNDLFSLDYPSASAYPEHSVPGSERHRLVATAIAGLPFGIRFSTIVSLGSGGATNISDFSEGFSLANRLSTQPFKSSVYPERSWGFAERNVDLRLEKDFNLGPARLDLIGEVFNAFNQTTFGCLENFIGPGPDGTKGSNPNLGNPNCVTNLARRFQAGVRVNF